MLLFFGFSAHAETPVRERYIWRSEVHGGAVGRPVASPTPQGMTFREQSQLLKSSECEWVENAMPGAPVTDSIHSYFSTGCGDSRICIGSARCVTSPDLGGFTYYVEHVACLANAQGCLAIKDCILDSGAMDDVKTEEFIETRKVNNRYPVGSGR